MGTPPISSQEMRASCWGTSCRSRAWYARLRTETDTETIVHLYEQYGSECVSHLRGMFALALWDEKRRRLARFSYRGRPILDWNGGSLAPQVEKLARWDTHNKKARFLALMPYIIK